MIQAEQLHFEGQKLQLKATGYKLQARPVMLAACRLMRAAIV
jgi:hypothetical protein